MVNDRYVGWPLNEWTTAGLASRSNVCTGRRVSIIQSDWGFVSDQILPLCWRAGTLSRLRPLSQSVAGPNAAIYDYLKPPSWLFKTQIEAGGETAFRQSHR